MNQKLSPIDEAKLNSNRHNMAPRTSYFQDELNALRKENAELKEKVDDYKKIIATVTLAYDNAVAANNFLHAFEEWLRN